MNVQIISNILKIYLQTVNPSFTHLIWSIDSFIRVSPKSSYNLHYVCA